VHAAQRLPFSNGCHAGTFFALYARLHLVCRAVFLIDAIESKKPCMQAFMLRTRLFWQKVGGVFRRLQ
jgi:hypothetical protein